jgi:4-aminobutyrate aminotransferase-like enzyme
MLKEKDFCWGLNLLKAFSKGLAWIPAGHILRMSPPLIMDEKYAMLGLDIIEESIGEVEKEFGYYC